MITADISNIWGSLSLSDLLSTEQDISAAHEKLTAGDGAGAEFLGWLRLPTQPDRAELVRIQAAAKKIRETAQVLVVVGIGGSYLGARAVIELLQGQRHNLRAGELQILYAGNSLSTRAWNELEDLLEQKDFCINIISKSGTTMEPAVAARALKWKLERKYGVDKARERIFVTTDHRHGALRKLAEEEHYESFSIPANVGGRYSVLSAVGLLPIAAAGIDIEALLAGAAEAAGALDVRSFDNPAWLYAAGRNLLYRQGRKIELLCSYEPDFAFFGRWWQQLFGESEGKNNRGLFPAYAEFTTDLHSLGQLLQQGERNMFETVIRFAPPKRRYAVELDWKDLDGLNDLAGKTLDYIDQQAFLGTLNAHVDGDVPVILLDGGELNAENVGALLYFFELSCGISAYYLGVNPFDQPGVETYKANMKSLLGRK